MATDFQISQFFEKKLDLRALLLGQKQLFPFPGEADSPWLRLYRLIEIAFLLRRGDFSQAAQVLQQLPSPEPTHFCHRALLIWLKGETEAIETAYSALDDLIDELQDARQPFRPLHWPRPVDNQDIRFARKWAPVLRVYLTARLPEITPAHIDQCQQDLAIARHAGIAEATLAHLTFRLRIALSRQRRCVDEVLAAAREWQTLCQQYPEYGNGDEYLLEGVLALEFDGRFDEALQWIAEGLDHLEAASIAERKDMMTEPDEKSVPETVTEPESVLGIQAPQSPAVSLPVASQQEMQPETTENTGSASNEMIPEAGTTAGNGSQPETSQFSQMQKSEQMDQLALLLIVKARILKRIGRVLECIAISDQLITLLPDDFSGYVLRSNAFFLIGSFDKALQDAEFACQVEPENPNSRMARAFVLMQMDRYEDALADFEEALRQDPERYDALRGKGKCLSLLGRDHEALTCYQQLRRVWPTDPDIFYELADILFSAGYLDDCERICRKCLELDDEYANAYVILGMVAMRRNEDDKARRLLSQAIDIEPDNPFALNELSYLTHLEGDDDTAIELVNRAIAESPEYADALCNKGVIHYFRSEFEQAAVIFERTLQLAPDHVGALVGKGNTLTQLSDFETALACFDIALELDPANVDVCHGKVMLYRMLGLDDEVREWQERAWQLEKASGDNDDESEDARDGYTFN